MQTNNPVFWMLGILFTSAISLYVRQKIACHNSNRKEDKDLIDKINDDIEEVEILAHKFFLLSGADLESKQLQVEINRILKRIGNNTFTLNSRFELSKISKSQLAFKQDITLGDFESVDREVKSSDDILFEKISDSGRRLSSVMELEFKKKYRNNK